MKVSRTRIAAAIAEQTATVPSKKLAQEVAAYLLAERRVGELESVVRDIIQWRADHGIVEVTAVSAFPLAEAAEAEIEAAVKTQYPQAKIIIIDTVLDETMIGGVRLLLPNEQLDLSLRAKLNRFKQLTTAKH